MEIIAVELTNRRCDVFGPIRFAKLVWSDRTKLIVTYEAGLAALNHLRNSAE